MKRHRQSDGKVTFAPTLLDDLGIVGDVEADEMSCGVMVHEHGERIGRLGIE